MTETRQRRVNVVLTAVVVGVIVGPPLVRGVWFATQLVVIGVTGCVLAAGAGLEAVGLAPW